MTNTFNELKEELRAFYPEITDIELNEATETLIKFFAIGAKAIYETEKQSNGQNIN